MVNDLYDSISIIMQNKLNEALSTESTCFLVEVTKTDGQYVSVKLKSNEDEYRDCENIPIIQSQYFSPIVKVGDIGLALNIKIDIGNALNDLPLDRCIFNQDYLVFLPLITKSQFKSSTNILSINSEDLQSKIELSNEKLLINCSKDLETLAKGQYDIKITGAYSLSAASLTLAATGAEPLKIKNSAGSLADVVTQLFTCMDALSAGLTGSTSNPAAYNAAKPAAQALINQIVG